MPTSNRLAFPHLSSSESVTSRPAVYGPVRTVVWQGSAGEPPPLCRFWCSSRIMAVGRSAWSSSAGNLARRAGRCALAVMLFFTASAHFTSMRHDLVRIVFACWSTQKTD